ncbi:MAG: hypothetical protein IJS02_01110 [Bacteroidales bacterium]|nr:hypothetical protein [Bacteroidales bacterium]
MEFLFPYHKSINNPDNIIQKKLMHQMEQLLRDGENIAYISAPKTGKKSVIHCAIEELSQEERIIHTTFDLLSFFSRASFLNKYLETFRKINDTLNESIVLPLTINYNSLSAEEILNLPEIIAKTHDIKIVISFLEFQNIMSFDNCSDFLDEFEKVVTKHTSVKYIFSGSMINRMKYIFEDYKYFFNFANIIEVPTPTKKECQQYLEDKFLVVGKEIDKDISDLMYDVCGGHPWYVMHLASICHMITPGYVTKQIVYQSIDRLINIHEIRFRNIISDITANQFNLILAILDNVKRLSSAESMAKYHLNSSAQIARSREALMKKEIITFDKEDRGHIIDPLFEYWLKNYYLQSDISQ